MIWSASAASCAIPYVYGATDLYCKNHEGKLEKYTLMNKQFLDGSLGHDLPMNKLSIFFNVNNFIVSQTNPWYISLIIQGHSVHGLHRRVQNDYKSFTDSLLTFVSSNQVIYALRVQT